MIIYWLYGEDECYFYYFLIIGSSDNVKEKVIN